MISNLSLAFELTSGIGKVIRDGGGQASGRHDHEVLDLVITNALIVDWTGIYKVIATDPTVCSVSLTSL